MKNTEKCLNELRIAAGILLFMTVISGGANAAAVSQWATGATASSQWSTSSWSAMQATGAPNTFSYGDIGTAWAPRLQNGGIQWIELTYATSVYANRVNVHETWGAGSLTKIEVKEGTTYHIVWEGTDPNHGKNEIVWSNISFPETTYPITTVKLYINIDSHLDQWEEIDAVELKGSDTPTHGIPEFPTIALPVAAVLGIMFMISRKRQN